MKVHLKAVVGNGSVYGYLKAAMKVMSKLNKTVCYLLLFAKVLILFIPLVYRLYRPNS